MTERRRPRAPALAALLALVAGLLGAPIQAQAQTRQTYSIGYLELADDPRYAERRAYAGLLLHPRHRPVDGARLSLRGSRILGRPLKLKFALEQADGSDADALVAHIERLQAERGVGFFLADLPAGLLLEVAGRTAGRDLALLNVSEPADRLRAADCQPHLLHLAPSRRMLADALLQHVISRGWRRAMVLQGPRPDDRALAAQFLKSARRFGAKVVQVRDFVLSNDPRERDRNNVSLLTGGADYDVLLLADTDGEFGRYVPYQTHLPRPVVGTEGLVATAWHWSWERHGAPQLTRRFDKRVKRQMNADDWAAWAGVRAVVESVVRTKSTDFAAVRDYLKSERLNLDGYKGNPMSFRPWNNQLRQPILLHTHNAVIARAPVKGYLHQFNTLDTLGADRGDTGCEF